MSLSSDRCLINSCIVQLFYRQIFQKIYTVARGSECQCTVIKPTKGIIVIDSDAELIFTFPEEFCGNRVFSGDFPIGFLEAEGTMVNKSAV